MIKVGDKVICISEVSLNIYNQERRSFKIGEVCEVVKYAENTFEYVKDAKYVQLRGNTDSLFFYLDKPIRQWKNFSDHFITMAEWREQQINSILDDE